jgi:hypothetical protein
MILGGGGIFGTGGGGGSSFSAGVQTVVTDGVVTSNGYVQIQFAFAPSSQPSTQPSSQPTRPSSQPTSRPTSPSSQPTGQPSRQPLGHPTAQPSRQPTRQPTSQPTRLPTRQPTGQPTNQPISHPSSQPTVNPTVLIASPGLRNGLVAYYPFDGTVEDGTGNGNNGVIKGTGVGFATDRMGQLQHAISLNGNGYVEISTGKNFNFRVNLTVCLWVLPSSNQAQFATLLDKTHQDALQNTYSSWTVGQSWSNVNLFNLNALHNTSSWLGSPSIQVQSAPVWSQLCFRKQSNQITSYLNGIPTNGTYVVSRQRQTILTNDNLPLLVGAANSGGSSPASNIQYYYSGAIDDIFIYNRSLTVKEINELYEFSAPTSQPTSRPSTIFQYVHNFTFTGSMQTFTVPPGVFWMRVRIAGAQGNCEDDSLTSGYGSLIRSILSVTPGTTLYLYVGGSNGWNGGGLATAGPQSWQNWPGECVGGGTCANGGGASDIRIGGMNLTNRVIVAGGGGGGSTYANGSPANKGGVGGNPNGGNGFGGGSASGGSGGTQASGGAAAVASCLGGQTSGILGKGGNGDTNSCGGGGGYYGGKISYRFF